MLWPRQAIQRFILLVLNKKNIVSRKEVTNVTDKYNNNNEGNTVSSQQHDATMWYLLRRGDSLKSASSALRSVICSFFVSTGPSSGFSSSSAEHPDQLPYSVYPPSTEIWDICPYLVITCYASSLFGHHVQHHDASMWYLLRRGDSLKSASSALRSVICSFFVSTGPSSGFSFSSAEHPDQLSYCVYPPSTEIWEICWSELSWISLSRWRMS